MEDRIEDTNGSQLPDEGDVTRGQEECNPKVSRTDAVARARSRQLDTMSEAKKAASVLFNLQVKHRLDADPAQEALNVEEKVLRERIHLARLRLSKAQLALGHLASDIQKFHAICVREHLAEREAVTGMQKNWSQKAALKVMATNEVRAGQV